MKSIRHHFGALSLGSALLAPFGAQAYTVEVDPVDPIPATHTQVYAVEWDTDGDLEGWAANGQFTLDPGTPTSGQVSGSTTGNDPNINISGLVLESSADTIIEIKLTKPIADTSRVDLFWGDSSGGISGIRRLETLEPWASSPDGPAHVIRFTFAGEINGPINQFRYDMATASGLALSMDYLRVYSVIPNPALEWDPTISGGASLGGTGTWDSGTTANFWDGSAQLVWPAVSTAADRADFGGTAGVVTVDGAGVTVNELTAAAGYEFTGGPITFDGTDAALNATDTLFTAPFEVTSPDGLSINGNSNIFGAENSFTGDVELNTTQTQLLANGALGFGTLTTKTGNIFITAIDDDRSLENDVVYRGNRLIVNNATFNGFPSSTIGDLIIEGGFENSPGATPGDIYLRRDLTLNGVVSGPGIGGRALYFRGDAGICRLNNTANTFGGGANNAILIENTTFIEIAGDGSLGDPTNFLRKAAGADGGVRLNAAMTLSRDVEVEGNTAFVLDTNSFDTTLDGVISGLGPNDSRFYKRGDGRLTLSAAGPHELGNGGIKLEGGTLEIPTGVVVNQAGNGTVGNRGQLPGTILEITGGEFRTGYWGLARDVAGVSTFTLTDGTFVNNLEFLTGVAGDGIVNFDGGTADLNQFSMVNGAGQTSTLNLNGTDFSLNFFNDRGGVGDEGDCIINFNGSTISAESDRDTGKGFIESEVTNVTCNVQAGGAIIDSAGFNLLVVPPLLHDPALGATLDGGLTKQGEGNLLLVGASTYTGDTNVDGGCLNLNDITAIPDLTKVNVAAGAGFGGIVGASNLLDADIQSIVDTVNWDAGGGSFLVIDTNGADVTVAANITGDIGLIKKGDGILTLTGANTFTGSTVVEGGSVVTPGDGIAIDSVVTEPGTNSGLKFTLSFTASGNVDVYASDDLETWTQVADDLAASPFVEDDLANPRRFYVVVTAGETFPPAP